MVGALLIVRYFQVKSSKNAVWPWSGPEVNAKISAWHTRAGLRKSRVPASGLPYFRRKFDPIVSVLVVDDKFLVLSEPKTGQDASSTCFYRRLFRGYGRSQDGQHITHNMESVTKKRPAWSRGI